MDFTYVLHNSGQHKSFLKADLVLQPCSVLIAYKPLLFYLPSSHQSTDQNSPAMHLNRKHV